jgi:hypothetical protein
MGSTWKCSAGALQAPSAGLHVTVCQRRRHRVECEPQQPILGLGEGNILACSSHKTARITAGSSACGILASRRRIRKNSLKPQTGFGNYLGLGYVHNSFSNSECLSIGWSRRLLFTSPHAHDNNNSNSVSSPSPESPRYDSEEDTEYAERRRNNAFKDFSEQTGGEPYGDHWKKIKDGMVPPNFVSAADGNGEYQRLSSTSDLFREVRDSVRGRDSVWAHEGRAEDGEADRHGDGASSANSAGYESWSEHSESSTESGSSSSVGSAADSLAIGGKEPVFQVGRAMKFILTRVF